jgi:hypothetical protein
MQMSTSRSIRYARNLRSLFFPGRASDFFPLGNAVSGSEACSALRG